MTFYQNSILEFKNDLIVLSIGKTLEDKRVCDLCDSKNPDSLIINFKKGTLRAICWSHSACRREAAQVESEGMHVIYT